MFQFLGYSNVDFQTLRSTTTASYAEISLVSNLPIKRGDFYIQTVAHLHLVLSIAKETTGSIYC